MYRNVNINVVFKTIFDREKNQFIFLFHYRINYFNYLCIGVLY